MKKYLRFLGPVLVTLIFILAIYLLYNKLKAYSITQIQESIQHISTSRIIFSFVLMIINYIILVGYDWLALKAIHKKLPLPRVGLVSFIGQAVSYNFGALLGGTSVRYRFYSAWGFSLADIVRLVLMLAVTFWVGALGLCGLIFLMHPPMIPPELLDNMPISDVRILGIILSALAFSYLVLCFFIRKPIHIFKKEFVFPSPGIAIAQFIVAGIDIIAAAGCMYVLLPAHIGLSFVDFLPSYLMAQVAVVLTHVPGGVGIFELVILELTHTPDAQVVFAAVLLFRIIYYIIPLLAAALLLAVYEARQRKYVLREAGRWLSVLSHSIAAYLTFVAGIILLVSAALPTTPATFATLSSILPMWLSNLGHFICTFSGAILLFVAWGLERRQSASFRMAVFFLTLGIAGALVKSLSWVVATMVGVILLAVCLAHRRFYRSSFFMEESVPAYWMIASICVLVLVGMLAWFIYHPLWDKSFAWGFESSLNIRRVLASFIGTAIVLAILWARRFRILRKK